MFNNKTILITGGTGSWGNELTKQLLEKYNPKEIRIYSRGEPKQVQMRIKYHHEPRVKFYIGDVRDKNKLIITSRDVDYIFHLAALKHVPICEENPWESVLTNIYGTRNVIEAAIENKVKKVIDISSDKAVDPFNIYGICKSCGEKLIIAANRESKDTSFVCIRAGNVMGTSGSVIPLFREQIVTNNEVTITDENMSRFFLTLNQAIQLVFRASEKAVGGEVFVMKMPATKIMSLAEVMIKELGNSETKIKRIGIRPGEKIYEVLISKYESPRCIESEDYFIILPQIKLPKTEKYYSKKKIAKIEEFNSMNTRIMDNVELRDILIEEGFLSKTGDYYGKDLTKKELKGIFEAEGWQK